MRLLLENETDSLDLDSIAQENRGYQALSGATGLGLPAKQVQWTEGAGDGSKSRGRRTLSRDIDLPILLLGEDRGDLRSLMSRLNSMLAKQHTLVLVDDDGTEWTAKVDHVGGGDYAYGVDTNGGLDIQTAITLRAGDPYFTARVPVTQGVRRQTGRGLLPKLGNLRLTGDQAIGTIQLNNPGDQSAHVVWTVHGPGNNFQAVSSAGETLHWTGTLDIGQTITVDTAKATVVDQDGLNRYAELTPAPRFWQVPPGTSTCIAQMADVDGNSYITASWYPRTWVVI